MLPLDLRTLNRALGIAGRLSASGSSPEGLSLLRELLAILANSNADPAVMEAWIAFASRALPPDNIVAAYCRDLPRIIETFATSGYATEAVRVMATGAGLDPAMSTQLFKAAFSAFNRYIPKNKPQNLFGAADDLTRIGMRVLEAGNPEGVTLMGSAHNVAPEIKFPVEDITANLDRLQQRQPAALDLGDVQALTDAAYDLHDSGRREPAVRLGALVPSMLPGPSAEQLFTRLEDAAGPGTEKTFGASRQLLDKGYAAQAANLLIDSGSVSADHIWASLAGEITGPSQELKSPSGVSSWARRIRSWLANPARVDPPDPSFFFTLEGEGARCDEALWGQAFDLVFRYDVLPADRLADVKGEKFQRLLRNTKAELRIEVEPRGALTLADGAYGRIAKFEHGRMVGDPPRFRLMATEKCPSAKLDPCGVRISFFIHNSTIYQFFLNIKLVDQFTTGPCTPHKILDLDLEGLVTATVEPRDARLRITSDGDAWRLSWEIDGVSSKREQRITLLSAAKLDEGYNAEGDASILKYLTRIAEDSIWKDIDQEFQLGQESQDTARECLKKGMTAGSKLYQLFSRDPILKEALDRIEKLLDGAKIEITTDDTAFPWELYPLKYNDGYPEQNYQPDRFWGQRFVIESVLATTSEAEKIPTDRQQPGKLYLSMALDSHIDIDKEWQQRKRYPVQLQKQYFDTSLSDCGQWFDHYEDILKNIIRSQPNSASLIYFFCHGTKDQRAFGESKFTASEVDVDGEDYRGWPIVFINACEAGNISPLSLISFRANFRKRKAAGLIAPSFPIPTLFAAVFAKALIARYREHQPIGKALLELRRELLAKHNPLGLWYSLQCPLDVKAPEQ